MVQFWHIRSLVESHALEFGASMLMDQVDERSNAAIGLSLAALSTSGDLLFIKPVLAARIRNWKPRSKTRPSTIEYLAGAKLMASADDTHHLQARPKFQPIDAEVVYGFIMSQRGFYEIARTTLTKSLADIESRYGSTSLEYGITVAELTNCCNILREEDDAERWAARALAVRHTQELTHRPDWFYLSVAQADSFIGRAEYRIAVSKLQEILDNLASPPVITMMTALRMAKVHRRLQEGGEGAFESESPLWIAAAEFDKVSDVLKLEFLEEVACNLSLLEDTDRKGTGRPGELIAGIDNILRNQKITLWEAPSCQWYLDMQRTYKSAIGKGDLVSPNSFLELPVSEEETKHQPTAEDDSVHVRSINTQTMVKVETSESSQFSDLHYAAKNGHLRTLRVLLLSKPNLNSKDREYGQTPLSYAAENGHEEVVKLLLTTDKADVESKDDDGRTPLSHAAGNGYEPVVQLLLASDKVDVESKDNDGRTPLSYAAGNGYEAVVKLLLATDRVDVESKNDDGRTPLSHAVGRGYEAVVKLLLATGKVDVESKDNNGRTSLIYAAGHGNVAVVQLLLATDKVDVESKDNDGRTPLSYAAGNGYEAVLKLLLATDKVDVESKDNKGRTPLLYAAGHGKEAVVKLLLATDRVDVESKDDDGWTPLLYAVGNGYEAVVKLLELNTR